MKKTWLIVIVVAIILIGSLMGRYNNMVSKDENVKTKWSQVENQYQRRLDLIPNLVSTVKGFAKQEQTVLQQVIEARAGATKTNINISDAKEFAAFQQSQTQLSSALSRLLVTVEAYPELKSNQNFLELQAQLEGTENRISVERKTFNESVQDYNTYIRRFPSNIIASLFGFMQKQQFQADEGANKAPAVNFDSTDTTPTTTTQTATNTNPEPAAAVTTGN